MSASASKPLVLVGICQEDDATFVVIDGNGTEHRASDPHGLGLILARLVVDPAIPRTVPDSTQRNPVIDVAARVARKLVPEQRNVLDVIEPFAHLVTNKLTEVASRPRRNPATGRRKRAQARTGRM